MSGLLSPPRKTPARHHLRRARRCVWKRRPPEAQLRRRSSASAVRRSGCLRLQARLSAGWRLPLPKTEPLFRALGMPAPCFILPCPLPNCRFVLFGCNYLTTQSERFPCVDSLERRNQMLKCLYWESALKLPILTILIPSLPLSFPVTSSLSAFFPPLSHSTLFSSPLFPFPIM